MSVQLKTRCEHQKRGIAHVGSVSDHHPLSKDDIAYLLRMARNTPSQALLSEIQTRLHKGVKGYTCPVQLFGPVATRIQYVSTLFKARYKEGDTEQLVNAFYSLLNE